MACKTVAVETTGQADADVWAAAVEEHELLSAGRRRPRPAAIPRRRDDAGHVRERPAELRRGAAARPAARPRARTGHGRRRGRHPAHCRRRLQRVRLQGAVRHERLAPRPAGLRPHRVRRLRARHDRHPRRDRSALRHQVRPGGLRSRGHLDRARLPRRHRRLRQRPGPARGRHGLRRRPDRVPAGADLRARALHDRDRRRTSGATSSSAAASSSSTRRAWSRCCAPTCAATRARCSPPSDRCSSRSWRSAWPTSSTRRSGSRRWTTRWRARPTRPARSPSVAARGVEVLQRSDGTHLAIFVDQWRATATARDNPDVHARGAARRRRLRIRADRDHGQDGGHARVCRLGSRRRGDQPRARTRAGATGRARGRLRGPARLPTRRAAPSSSVGARPGRRDSPPRSAPPGTRGSSR